MHIEHLRECEERMPSLSASEANKVFTRLKEVRDFTVIMLDDGLSQKGLTSVC